MEVLLFISYWMSFPWNRNLPVNNMCRITPREKTSATGDRQSPFLSSKNSGGM
jgi:hypothetical protein